MKCSEAFAADILPIEKKFIAFKQSLQDKPISLVAAHVQRVIQRSEITESSEKEELKTRYLRWRLQQWQAEIREKINTISLSPALIRSLRSKYVHDTQFFHAIRQYIIPRLVMA